MIVIAGSGFAGAATAWWLARRGHGARTILVEGEQELGVHASGSNAGLIASLAEDPVTCRFTVRGAAFLRERFGIPPRGSVMIAQDDGRLAGLRERARQHEVPVEAAETGVLSRGLAPLAGARGRFALVCRQDATIEPRRVLERFVREACEGGVRMVAGARVTAIETRSGRIRSVTAGGSRLEADHIVDAAGAWAGEVARLAGLSDLGLQSYRRHLLVSEPLERLDDAWPFVWDLDEQVYFRADGGRLTMSPCDDERHPPAAPVVWDGAEAALRRKLSACLPALARIPVSTKRACLRTFAADRRYVVGPDPRLDGFFWAAGLGGTGATSAAAVGELAAGLLLEGRAGAAGADEVDPARLVRGAGAAGQTS